MTAAEPTPLERAAEALTNAIADDLYAASTTGDVIDMLVKGDYETWREHVERIGGIAAESTPAAVRGLLAGDWLERTLAEADTHTLAEPTIPCGLCALYRKQAAAIRATAGVGL